MVSPGTHHYSIYPTLVEGLLGEHPGGHRGPLIGSAIERFDGGPDFTEASDSTSDCLIQEGRTKTETR